MRAPSLKIFHTKFSTSALYNCGNKNRRQNPVWEFTKTIIPFALVGYEVIITISRYALVGYFITSYPTRAHGIIVIYLIRGMVMKPNQVRFCSLSWPWTTQNTMVVRLCRRNKPIETFWLRNHECVWTQNKRLRTIMDLPTLILVSLFAPLMFVGLHNQSP